ncbi:hypothetical protein HMPREF9420_1240 [Segatella salivae DSM 15606]|uniref:Uncharacterized protein n=1 Tax=Segatella salivae DSM 15606 TaxID=888832 RepID=E6MP22_9BACT|nr:hypothetical protein HMPREF9420_1240 [Segatella salivae DSM 15606]
MHSYPLQKTESECIQQKKHQFSLCFDSYGSLINKGSIVHKLQSCFLYRANDLTICLTSPHDLMQNTPSFDANYRMK